MDSSEIAAFNMASGTTVTELQYFILSTLFVVACLWAVIMFKGKLASLKSQTSINVPQFIFTGVRILIVLVIILFLVNL